MSSIDWREAVESATRLVNATDLLDDKAADELKRWSLKAYLEAVKGFVRERLLELEEVSEP